MARGREVAWAACTGGLLTFVGVLLAGALAAPGWVDALVVVICFLVGAPLGARLQRWVDHR